MISTNKPSLAGLQHLRRCAIVIAASLALFSPLASAQTDDSADVPSILQSTQRQYEVSQLVAKFAERAHYSRSVIDDRLSEQLLDNYIDALDGNRHYFLEPDIAYFSKYQYELDDILKSGDMEPVFDIFRLYRLRAQQQLNYAIGLLDQEPDFEIDEYYVFDRTDMPWPADTAQRRELWRLRVKNDLLSLALTDNFINSFARTLDPHSSYMSPRHSEEYRIQMSLSYQGIGASLQLDEEYVTVLGIIPGGPAAIDGRMKPKDRIIAVGQGDDGSMVDVIGWQLDEVVQLIRGASGTMVRLQILPGDTAPGEADYELDLVRDKIKLEEQAAKSSVLDIERDTQSSRGEKDFVSTTRDVRRLIEELEGENVDGLVIDLRGNGGGHLSEATSLSGLFIESGPVVQLRDTNGRIEVLKDPEPSTAYDGPLVVLVDRYSASASEIFAAAIQDYRRGVVIGQQTFGKGTVQNLYVLDQYTRKDLEPGLGQLTLTIGKYYRVTGDSTQHRGVIPDIELPSLLDTNDVGESSRPGALPWDQITATRFSSELPLDNTIVSLSEGQQVRSVGDPDFQYLVQDIAALDAIRTQNSVSLNLEVRRAEMDARRQARLDRENDRRAALGLEPLESAEELDEAERPDILLQQAAEIATDLALLNSGEPAFLTDLSLH
jgi:carboxyl-terminal processing protease